MRDTRRNVFVVGLDEFNHRLLRQIPHAEEFTFHPLLNYEDVVSAAQPDARALLDQANGILEAFDGSADAIVCFWDFPGVCLTPMLQHRHGIPGPSLDSVLRCEHKYWSRLTQAAVIPDHVPRFALADPFAEDLRDQLDLDFPFWLKPVTAHSSLLGFRVENQNDLDECLPQIRRGIRRWAEPLEFFMQHADVPDEVRSRGGAMCIAESLIDTRWQCTVEGYVYAGEVETYGVVDSVRAHGRSSFERYEYPSQLPERTRERLIGLSREVVRAVGLDNSAFNIEYFCDGDDISLLEINARISQSHSPLFWKVDGSPHKEVMLDLALGRRPTFELGSGPYRLAAKFMPRSYCGPEATVTHVPNEDEIREIENRLPGTEVQVDVKRGMRTSELPRRDSYSAEIANIFVGAENHKELMQRYDQCMEALDIKIS